MIAEGDLQEGRQRQSGRQRCGGFDWEAVMPRRCFLALRPFGRIRSVKSVEKAFCDRFHDRFGGTGPSKGPEMTGMRWMLVYLEDKQLVKRMLAQEPAAFDEFFEQNFQRLFRFALARLSHETEAGKEVAQSAMSKAIRNLHGYRGEAALFTWLCAICRNEISDWVAKQARYRKHIILTEDYPELRAVVESIQESDGSDPEANYERAELRRLIHVALDSLPPKYGNALEWKYIEGHSVKEIAGRLGVGHEAAQSLLARARRAFHDVYQSLSAPLVQQESTES